MFNRIKRNFNHRFNRFYRRSRLYLIIDIVLIAVVIILGALLLRLYAYQPDINISPWSKVPEKPEINLNNPPLDLDFSIENSNIYWQEGAIINIRLKNNSDKDIKDVNLDFIVQNENYSISLIEFSLQQKTSLSGMKIKGSNLYLDQLSAGNDRDVNLLVYFQKKNENSRVINWRLDVEYNVFDQTIKESFLLDELKVASELKAEAYAYYNSPQGDQLGTGPFPPIVEFPTNLWVFFRSEPDSDFKNFVMSARLPENVKFTDNVSLLAGDINYNPDARQVVWQVNNLDSNADDYRAGFEIQLTPTKDQMGSFVSLLTNIKFQATDYFTGLPVGGSIYNIDTSLQNDVINRNEGKVMSIDEL